MTTRSNEQLAQTIVDRNNRVQIGNYLNDGFFIFTKHTKLMIGMIFFTMISLLLTGNVSKIFSHFFLSGRRLPNYSGYDLKVAAIYLIGIILSDILLQLLQSNLFIVTFKIMRRQSISRRDFWGVFLSLDLFVGVCFISLIRYVIMIPLSLPMILSPSSEALPVGIYILGYWLIWVLAPVAPSIGDFLVILMLIAVLVCAIILGAIYLSTAYSFALPLVIEKHFNSSLALTTSRKLVTKRWFSIFVFGLVISTLCAFVSPLNLAGVQIGLSVMVPWSICTIASAYADIVGLNGATQDGR